MNEPKHYREVLLQFSNTLHVFIYECENFSHAKGDAPAQNININEAKSKLDQIVENLLNVLPKFTIAFQSPPVPKVEDCSPLAKLAITPLICLVSLYQDVTARSSKAVKTSFSKSLLKVLKSFVELSTALSNQNDQSVKEANSDKDEVTEVTRKFGLVQSSLKEIQKITFDDVLATRRALFLPTSLIKDALNEMNETLNTTDREGPYDENNGNPEANGNDDQDLLDLLSSQYVSPLSKEEKEIIPGILMLFKATGGMLDRIQQTLKASSISDQDPKILDSVIERAMELSLLCDELGASIYPPQNFAICRESAEKLRSAIQSLLQYLTIETHLLPEDDGRKLATVIERLLEQGMATFNKCK